MSAVVGSAAKTLGLLKHMPTGLTAAQLNGSVLLLRDEADPHAGINISGWEAR